MIKVIFLTIYLLMSFLLGCNSKPKLDLAIWSSQTLLVDDDGRSLSDKYILINDGKIVDIVEESALSLYRFKKVLKNKNSLVLPGFANTHTHVAMHSLRGRFGHFDIKKWWQDDMKPHEDRFLSPSYVLENSLKGINEQLANGTTLINDMFLYSSEVIKAAKKAGIRGVFGETLYTDRKLDHKNFNTIIKEYSRLYNLYKNDVDIKISIAPHGFFAITNKDLEHAIRIARRDKSLFHTHHNETSIDNEVMVRRGFLSSSHSLKKLGLGQGHNVLLAHGVVNNTNDRDILKESNVSYSINLISNQLLGVGPADFKLLSEMSKYLSLGTDSVATNPSSSMREEIRSVFIYFRYINKFKSLDFAKKVLKMATYNGYMALGFKNGGLIQKGRDADFQVYSFKSKPHTSFYEDFILNTNNYQLEKVYIRGRQVYTR